MDQGLKERLIGAAVLVALGVWLIPWLLDGPDAPITTDGGAIELPVPSGHVGEMRTEVIDLAARRDGGRSAPAGAGRAADSVSARSGDASGSRDATPASTTQAATASGREPAASSDRSQSNETEETRVSASTAAPASDRGSAAPSNDAPSAAAANRAETEQRTSASSQASGGGASPATAARPASAARAEVAESGNWAVQVGSFSEEENARRHAARVSSLGYSPRISTFRAGGRVMYRVRIGPHETRAAAEAVASALAAHGFVAQVVTNN